MGYIHMYARLYQANMFVDLFLSLYFIHMFIVCCCFFCQICLPFDSAATAGFVLLFFFILTSGAFKCLEKNVLVLNWMSRYGLRLI